MASILDERDALDGAADDLPGQAEILAAQQRLRGWAVRTPLLEFETAGARPLYLKPEMLQPIGSFKIRCGVNAVRARLDAGTQPERFSTASAGNFAQGLAWAARRCGLPVEAFVPDTAARSKCEALARLGAEVIPLPYECWWAKLTEPSRDPGFVHPVTDRHGIAGNATIGLEILEDLPDVGTVLVPFGGGGLAVGIAQALRTAGSDARVIACETEAGTPLAASFAAGEPVTVAFDSGTFITGMGSPSLIPSMWPHLRRLISGTAMVSLAEVAAAIRILASRSHLIAEGAGAVPLAAGLRAGWREPVVCILSGGHLDPHHLLAILQDKVP